MNTTTSRGLIGFAAAPVAAAGILASALGLSAVAHASATPGVNTHLSGMVLSREYAAQQKQEHAKAGAPIDLQRQQEGQQSDSPAQQERAEPKLNLKAEERKEGALKTVESLENVQTAEPKAHVYALKTPVHKKLGLMRAGFSQMAR